MESKSRAIVSFLANLLPVYVGEIYEGSYAARSLKDGSLILQVDCFDDPDNDDWVRILWQGDPMKSSEVNGSLYATSAVVEYVRTQYLGCSYEQIRWELAEMSRHFTFKTGASLYLPYEPENEGLDAWVARAIREVGNAAVIEALKKVAGL